MWDYCGGDIPRMQKNIASSCSPWKPKFALFQPDENLRQLPREQSLRTTHRFFPINVKNQKYSTHSSDLSFERRRCSSRDGRRAYLPAIGYAWPGGTYLEGWRETGLCLDLARRFCKCSPPPSFWIHLHLFLPLHPHPFPRTLKPPYQCEHLPNSQLSIGVINNDLMYFLVN